MVKPAPTDSLLEDLDLKLNAYNFSVSFAYAIILIMTTEFSIVFYVILSILIYNNFLKNSGNLVNSNQIGTFAPDIKLSAPQPFWGTVQIEGS